jgi:hypothetical protein
MMHNRIANQNGMLDCRGANVLLGQKAEHCIVNHTPNHVTKLSSVGIRLTAVTGTGDDIKTNRVLWIWQGEISKEKGVVHIPEMYAYLRSPEVNRDAQS